jgi:hypothetical protein
MMTTVDPVRKRSFEMKQVAFWAVLAIIGLGLAACGGGQHDQVNMEIRPLEENRAFEIIEEMLAERSYFSDRDVNVQLANKTQFACDYRVKDHKIAIEFLTEQDKLSLGNIPAPAAGSRLHVINGRVVPKAAPGSQPAPGATASRGEPIYVFFIDERNFVYQVNPTSEHRADVTFLEVDSRLRRDIADFLSWYETNIIKR